jgi:hypothetical protein
LPKWAQRELASLEADLAAARAALSVGPDDADTFADPYADPPRPIGRGGLIRFGGLWPYAFDARLVGGALEIRGEGAISVRPQASNVIVVEVTR